MKLLTVQNWLDPDPIIQSGVFVRQSLVTGAVAPITPDEWAERILAPQLADAVPSDIRAMYEVARGAIVYGVLFYPLFTLGLEQVYRIMETVASEKAVRVGIPLTTRKGQAKRFRDVVQALHDVGVLTAIERDQWSATRQLRNFASHPPRITVLTPGDVVGILRSLTDTINRLLA